MKYEGLTLDRMENVLSDWEWMTLVGAMRYYQYRSSIASVTFPKNVVARYWGSGEYGKAVQIQVANQFAIVDHGVNGEGDWDELADADRLPWCKFFAFCKGVCHGFTKYRCMVDGKDRICECFRCETNGRAYPVEMYIRDPSLEVFINEDKCVQVGGIS